MIFNIIYFLSILSLIIPCFCLKESHMRKALKSRSSSSSSIGSSGSNSDSQDINKPKNTEITGYAYHISIRNKTHHICSGAIAKDDAVITSAACVCDIPIKKLYGEIFVASKTTWRDIPVTENKIIKRTCPPSGNGEQRYPLVATLNVKDRFEKSDNQKVIRMTQNKPQESVYYTYTGWPVKSNTEHTKLQYIRLQVLNENFCIDEFHDAYDVTTMFCATSRVFSKGYNLNPLNDLGGPLIGRSGDLMGIMIHAKKYHDEVLYVFSNVNVLMQIKE